MKIQILQGHHQPIAKTIKDKTYYSQYAFIHRNRAFPERIQIPIEAPINAYPVGFYTLDNELSYSISKYERLEIDPYNHALTPILDSKKSI
jgi:hypothetical protein